MIDLAKQLATLASELDEGKLDLPPVLGAQAFSCALQMHQLAKALAGARMGEIYDASVEQEPIPVSATEETCV
jgi:hypothetical protein